MLILFHAKIIIIILFILYFKVRNYFHHNGPNQVSPAPYTIPSCNGYLVSTNENIKTVSGKYIDNAHLKEDDNFFHNDKSHYDYPLHDVDGKGQEKQRDKEETYSPSRTYHNENQIHRELSIFCAKHAFLFKLSIILYRYSYFLLLIFSFYGVT